MKQTTLKTVYAMFIAIIIGLTACKKEKGPQGDAGPQGPAGTNAQNNKSAPTFTINAGDWVNGCAGQCWAYNYPYVLDQQTVNTGQITGYFYTGAAWVQMPFTLNDSEYYFDYGFNFFNVKVRSAGGAIGVPMPGQLICKMVIIP